MTGCLTSCSSAITPGWYGSRPSPRREMGATLHSSGCTCAGGRRLGFEPNGRFRYTWTESSSPSPLASFRWSFSRRPSVYLPELREGLTAPNMKAKAKRYGVIFDLDGVLVDSSSFHFEAWKRLAAEEGFPVRVTESWFKSTFGQRNGLFLEPRSSSKTFTVRGFSLPSAPPPRGKTSSSSWRRPGLARTSPVW